MSGVKGLTCRAAFRVWSTPPTHTSQPGTCRGLSRDHAVSVPQPGGRQASAGRGLFICSVSGSLPSLPHRSCHQGWPAFQTSGDGLPKAPWGPRHNRQAL